MTIAKPFKLGPYSTGPNDLSGINGIYQGDAKELSEFIPDESIDLIFTDPIYSNFDDYQWLAKEAIRLLKPNSSLLAFCSNIGQYTIQPLMAQHLTFILPLNYVVIGKSYRLMYYHTFVWTTPCLWFMKGDPAIGCPKKWIADTFISKGEFDEQAFAAQFGVNQTYVSTQPTARDNRHPFNKNPEAYATWMNALCPPGGIVFDPFCGGGTVPYVATSLDRHYLAFEIDLEIIMQARERVLRAPRPLPIEEQQQPLI